MSVEACHYVGIMRRGIEVCIKENRLKPGSVLPLGRLHPSRAIVTCEAENNKGTVIVRNPGNIVIEFYQSKEDKIGSIIDTEDLSEVYVSFSKEQWLTLYKKQKNIRRKIELVHVDDDFEADENIPLIDDRLAL